MSNLLKIILCLVLIVSGCAAPVLNKDKLLLDRAVENPSVELQLLDIHLGMPYEKAKALLSQKYGKPIRFQSTLPPAAIFKLDQKTNNVIEIIAKSDDPSVVEIATIYGTDPIAGLNFFSNANLGDSEENIHLKFPKVKMEQREGYRRYYIPFANYFLNVENGKVTGLGIWSRFTLPVKGENDSIDLSFNLAIIAQEKGWLTEKGVLSNPKNMEKIKALAFDSLRPHCKERYPMRLALNGSAYVDANFYKDEKEKPTSATFSLDTGWVITSISQELCRKVNCESGELPEFKLRFAGGIIELGAIRDAWGMITIMAPEAFRATEKVDGVLGNTSLFEKPLFINFKHGYLCTPTLTVPQVAWKLKFAKVSSDQRMKGLFTDFYANGHRLKYGRLDSGADTTTLSKKDIARLKLRDLQKTGEYLTVSRPLRLPLYGPVEIGWPSFGITKNLKEIAESHLEFPLIGMDFLRHYILSTEFKTGNVYIGE